MSANWLKLSFSDMPPAPTLAGAGIYLLQPRAGDWREWADLRLRSRDFLIPWEPIWPREALSKAAFRQRLKRTARDWRTDQGYGFFLFRAEDDVLLGGITLSGLRRGVTQSGSLGYWVGKPYARNGHMTAAVACMLDFAFDTLDLHRVEAACLPNNDASKRLLRKSGFVEEGFARGYLRINGSWQDHQLFAILAEDRRQQKGSEENRDSGDNAETNVRHRQSNEEYF